ncbi:MAG: uridine diphosphate-N-acetylglucosamine-binding protein YvcK [Clostridia bacterium]|nr:uridine diphosphate-N-acetylglucosamine-binding protein YvcK [Clostridia bacterium]
MNGFMQWFKSNSKLKRWMLVILIGILLICYGIAKILVLKEMSFTELIEIIVIFVIGVIATVLGLISFNKRTLEILIESTDNRMNDKKNVNVKSLIFDKKVYHQGPNIVVIGGGTGLNTVLSGLKKYTDNLTAIVTVSDYGEVETESRKELQTKPLNDVRDSMIALSTEDGQLDKLFNYQFTEGKLRNLTFSDIYFTAMKNINNDFSDSIIKSNEVLNIIGKVIPVTLDEMNITAELANGYIVTEKAKIPEVVYEKVTKINRIYLNPTNCRPAPGVIDAIKNADCIVIGPGSLYTNVIPNLLVNGVARAIKESTGLKVYISNIMTEPGQTDEYSVSDHLNAIIEHCGKGIVDYCIYDTGEVVPEFIKRYNLEGQDLVEPNIDKVKGITYLQRNLSMISNECIRHDPELVAKSIIELICDDLRYQDKQNDPQFLMLNNKLREDKRIDKVKKQMKRNNKRGKKNNKDNHRRNSKFSNKYSERIESIRQSNEMTKLKEQKIKKESAAKQKDEKTQEDEEVLKFRREYEKSIKEPKKAIATMPKSQRGRKRKTS